MKRIIVLGNGNSGAQAANAVFRNAKGCGSNTVEYYYEYGPHHGVTIDKSIKHSYASDMNKLEVEVSDIVISCGWAHKVPDDIVEFGNCYNIHPALLPNYRGSSPIERQIRNSESLSGITLHRMDAGYDTGPVFARVVYRIDNMSENDVVQIGIDAINKLVEAFIVKYPDIECIDQNDAQFAEKVLTFTLD